MLKGSVLLDDTKRGEDDDDDDNNPEIWRMATKSSGCDVQKQKLDKMRVNFVVLLGLVLLNGLWLGWAL